MSKSKKKKQHFMDNDQLEIMRGIRKPMPPPTKVVNPKDANKQKRWDWRDELENAEAEDDYTP